MTTTTVLLIVIIPLTSVYTYTSSRRLLPHHTLPPIYSRVYFFALRGVFIIDATLSLHSK